MVEFYHGSSILPSCLYPKKRTEGTVIISKNPPIYPNFHCKFNMVISLKVHFENRFYIKIQFVMHMYYYKLAVSR